MLLGRGNDCQPVRHELCFNKFHLEQRLPYCLILQLGIGVLLLVTLPVWKTNGQNADANGESIGIIGALKIKGVPFLLTGFFAYCAVEATAMYWASTYLVEVKGITVDRAAQFASLFYIGLTIGRFLGGFIMNKLGDRRMILLGTCILSCGVISLMLPTGNQLVSLIGFIIIGFGCAPVSPYYSFHTG